MSFYSRMITQLNIALDKTLNNSVASILHLSSYDFPPGKSVGGPIFINKLVATLVTTNFVTHTYIYKYHTYFYTRYSGKRQN